VARTRSEPWQWPEAEALPTLFGGLLAPGKVDRETALPVLRAAVEMVLGWVGVELTWSTFVDVVEDGVGNPRADGGRAGLDWAFVAAKPGTARWIQLEGVCTQLAGAFGHPNRRVVQISAYFPTYSKSHGHDVGRMAVGVSVQQWALYGSGEDMPWFTPALERWMLGSAAALGAEGGFAILDRMHGSGLESPWERHAYAYAEPGSGVWGYGWGTLLGPAHLERIGGLQSVTALPGSRVRDLPEGRVWVTLGDDPAAVPDEVMLALHEVLLPALAEPLMVEEAAGRQPAVVVPTTIQQVRAMWQEQEQTAREGARTSGMFGPVGFSLNLVDAVGPFATNLMPDCIVFSGLGHEQAATLLGELPAELLDTQVGAGPTLRRTFQAMIDHPGLVTVSGILFGPSRDDEGMMADQVQVHHDPVLSTLPAGDVEGAYQRLVALGIDAAAKPEQAGPTADGETWDFWWD